MGKSNMSDLLLYIQYFFSSLDLHGDDVEQQSDAASNQFRHSVQQEQFRFDSRRRVEYPRPNRP